MESIGLYIHQLRVFRDNVRLELGDAADQFDLRAIIEDFLVQAQANPLVTHSRSVGVADIHRHRDSIFGGLNYGSYGINADLVDLDTQRREFRRAENHVEVIPLYFGFLAPAGEDTWYVATQSFGNRSCSSTFNFNLENFFRDNNPGYQLTIGKVIPVHGEDVAGRQVREFTLIRRRAPANEAERNIGNLAREIDVELSISPHGRGGLGYFGDISDYVRGHRDRALIYNGIEFEEASATVRVGGKYRKVGIVGVQHSAGVVDITDDVGRGADRFPIMEQVNREAMRTMRDYLREYRDR